MLSRSPLGTAEAGRLTAVLPPRMPAHRNAAPSPRGPASFTFLANHAAPLRPTGQSSLPPGRFPPPRPAFCPIAAPYPIQLANEGKGKPEKGLLGQWCSEPGRRPDWQLSSRVRGGGGRFSSNRCARLRVTGEEVSGASVRRWATGQWEAGNG